MSGPFESLASLLLPADGTSALVLPAAPDWRFPSEVIPSPTPQAVLWGRAPWPPGDELRLVAGSALRREGSLLELRRMGRRSLSLAAVHRWPPPRLNAGAQWHRLRTVVLGGMVAELRPARNGRRRIQRVLDVVAGAAGAPSPVNRFSPAPAGSIMLRFTASGGGACLLRAAREGGSDDPAYAADALAQLARARIRKVPALIGRGSVAGASWTVETVLAGRRATALTPALVADCVEFCASLPRSAGPPTAPAINLGLLAQHFPGHAPGLDLVKMRVANTVERLPAVMRHGDFWTGNLLQTAGRLTGVVDWDACLQEGVPGADILHLLGTDRALRSRRELGQVWLEHPWQSDEFRGASAPYWKMMGIRPDGDILFAVAVGWWAAALGHSLRRFPQLADDPRWVSLNIDNVMASLGRDAGAAVA